MVSPMCHAEIAHALRYNKRLVPVMVQTPDVQAIFASLYDYPLKKIEREALRDEELHTVADANWQTMERHQWIMFQDVPLRLWSKRSTPI